MNDELTINKLPQEIINQIAAGEVIEKPASVVKELVDNSIDAGATKIEIFVEKGGKNKIEVRDNGIGMSREDLEVAFLPHTTSKVSTMEELDQLISMGFRGEALSTIISVANCEAISKKEDESGYKVTFDGIEIDEITEFPSSEGTTIAVHDLFYNIPARQKYLRTDETEYRNIYNMLLPYFINRNDIQFVLVKDNKGVINLPRTESLKDEVISQARLKEVIRSDFVNDLIPVHFDGNGIVVKGFVASPQHHLKRNRNRFLYINGRPVYDNGVNRSVIEGFGSFIPKGDSIPYILSLELTGGMVDINVHPRKEEVRFLNPYRIYSAIEQAVGDALKREYKGGNVVSNLDTKNDIAYTRLRGDNSAQNNFGGTYSSNPKSYSQRPSSGSVDDSITFSQELLSNEDRASSPFLNIRSANQIFNKYLVVEMEEELWIVDQHAAAERITYEALLSYKKSKEPEIQNFLLPKEVVLEEDSLSFFSENMDLFKRIGFSYRIDGDRIKIDSVPAQFAEVDIDALIRDLVDNNFEIKGSEEEINERTDQMLATIACHNSIRSSQHLEKEEVISLVEQLQKCDNPYSCPHGRPIVWKIPLDEIDQNFDRTY